MSAVLDNLTTTIVMLSLIRKLIAGKADRLQFAGMIIIAANAGGAWSPIGDVTTTMLWIGNQVTATNIILKLLLPSAVCLLIPLFFVARRMKGEVSKPASRENPKTKKEIFESRLILALGIGALVFVPVFKTITHLPPFMGMLLSLGILWSVTEIIHKDKADKDSFSVAKALQKIDTPSILFFLGILVAIGALQSTGMLTEMASWLTAKVQNINLLCISIGGLSAVIDNVPLVAAAQGMFGMQQYPTDHYFWEMIAYTTGTGGSILIIGSAAGVIAMGIEKINFIWYFKKFGLWALVGYLAGSIVYILQEKILHIL
jgi:Na+/H+ antiporter NhaD/arsenite permease-like protein